MTTERIPRVVLALLVITFLIIGTLYAVYTPPWQAPDEPAHYNYAAQIAEGEGWPVIAPGDWDINALSELTDDHFPVDANIDWIEYEDHQPPLYYMLGAGVLLLTGGSLLALRLMSVLMGAGVLIAAYVVVARMFPKHKPVALAAAAFVGFVPQHMAILASVNNDALAELILALLLAAAIRTLNDPATPGVDVPPNPAGKPHPALLGLLAGLAFLTKLTVYGPAVLVVGVTLILRARIEHRSLRWFAGQAALAGGMAVVLGSAWWVRNVIVYGWPDVFAQTAHHVAVVGQLRRAELIGMVGLNTYLKQLISTTYHSFFGQFGWMAVPFSPRIYQLIGVFLFGCLVGLVILAFSPHREKLTRSQRAALWLMGSLIALALGQYAYYNLIFVQFQGRYLYIALIPLGMLAAAGLWGWARLASRLLPDRWRPAAKWLPLVAMMWLAVLSVYALFRVVVPFLS